MKGFSLAIIAAGLLCSALPGLASGISICDNVSANIVQNCGFEAGVYESTVGGYTNENVPLDWTANAAFDEFPSWDLPTDSPVNSGNYALSIGNDDDNPPPMLSQTLSDTSGVTYYGSLYVDYGGAGTSDPLPYFDVQIDGTNVVALNYTAAGDYTKYTFSFVGTGSDTLSLTGNTNPDEWFVDDIVVTPGCTSAVPEPRSSFLLAGLGGAFLLLRRRFAAQR
jgi:hypothetical protein